MYFVNINSHMTIITKDVYNCLHLYVDYYSVVFRFTKVIMYVTDVP